MAKSHERAKPRVRWVDFEGALEGARIPLREFTDWVGVSRSTATMWKKRDRVPVWAMRLVGHFQLIRVTTGLVESWEGFMRVVRG